MFRITPLFAFLAVLLVSHEHHALTFNGAQAQTQNSGGVGLNSGSAKPQAVFPKTDASKPEPTKAEDKPALAKEPLLSGIHQLTLAGKRAGEGYFSPNGRLMIFQSERRSDNPFYQMYMLNRDTGDVRRISPGIGKTTCGWIHPLKPKALFASTQDDPQAQAKQAAELKFRASGQKRRYSWDYDENYELQVVDFATGKYTNLTKTRGYDAEGAYSPDGRQIVFASNREAYNRSLSKEEQALFDKNKSNFMDIYIMDADGGNVRRLTKAPGYDGGPFFSSDGRKIVWRRFATDGRSAEIFTMNVDGSNMRQVTNLGLMSWAPFFHPSGDYIIFSSNRYGHANFELFIIDAEGRADPVRVTNSKGFDGLPVFTPNGHSLSWTSKRSSDGTSQIFMADWNDIEARTLLGLTPHHGQKRVVEECGVCKARISRLRWHVATLASEQMQGRLTGTEGEKRATEYVANVFRLLGLEPAGDNGTYYQSFKFTSGLTLGKQNELSLQGAFVAAKPIKTETGNGVKQDASDAPSSKLMVDKDWRPLSFSKVGEVPAAPVVFAGYGIEAPKSLKGKAYNSYENADVKGKWVLLFRGIPKDVAPEQRLHLSHFSDLQYKASVARAKGAIGILVASSPRTKYKSDLVKLSLDAIGGTSSIAALSVNNGIYTQLIKPLGNGIGPLLEALDAGEKMRATLIPEVRLAARLDIVRETRTGRNVLARLRAGKGKDKAPLMIGAHVDHLGKGNVSGSLAKEEEKGQTHYGADDNASGVAALLELAERFSGQHKRGYVKPERDIVFAAWSGEELGLLGSAHFTKKLAKETGLKDLSSKISAYLNMDMVGRLDKHVILHGVGSSSVWQPIIERANILAGLNPKLVENSYVPTDATSLYLAGVPVLHAYTGAHEDYSTPRDTPDKINYEGLSKITTLMDGVVRQLVRSKRAPDYIKQKRPSRTGARRRSTVFLGTIPDYAGKGGKGVKLSGVMKGGPAEKAGLVAGDVIVNLANTPVENIYDYVRAINMLKVGETIKVIVLRDNARQDLSLTPAPKE